MMRAVGALAVWWGVLAALAVGQAAPAANERLLDRNPFDRVILNEANKGEALDVAPLGLKRPPAVLPTEGRLKVQLLERPTETFEIAWSDIARIEVFDALLMAEAQRLTAAGDFDTAFDYFARLSVEYPATPGLETAICDYLRRNALALFQARQNDRALALLLTLHGRNPRYPGLPAAVDAVAGAIIQQYLREQDYAAARGVLDLWQTQFAELASNSAAEWRRRFEAAAERQIAQAQELLQQRQYIPARKAAERALSIWPQSTAAGEVFSQIQRDFPFATVGVFEAAPERPSRRIDDWAARRVSSLLEPQLVEQSDFSAEGGVYRSPVGSLGPDDSGLELSLQVQPESGVGAPQLARYLLRSVDPARAGYRPELANLLAGVSVERGSELRLHWLRPHVRPEALLQVPLTAEVFDEATVSGSARLVAPFMVGDRTPGNTIFTAVPVAGQNSSRGLQAVIERRLADDELATAALLAGDIDVLDRVPPWQIDRLQSAPGVAVAGYRLPTVHVLIPNFDRPLLARREFRRALCFGIDRQWIVDRVLLAGKKRPGFEVVSGPFPTGLSLSDPLRYAYNNQLRPRPYEPRLAAILATVAWTGVQTAAAKQKQEAAAAKSKGEAAAEKSPDKDDAKAEDAPATDGEEVPAPSEMLPELVLAHPSDPVARVACQSIQLQLARVGIPVKLVEFTADELAADAIEFDLRYAELAVWEPVTDARLLLGANGLAGKLASPYLNAALRRLDEANNWKDVRARLGEIHEIAHHELPVIPLWQTANFYARRDVVGGIGEAPILLYQNIGNWSLSHGGNVAQTNPRP